MSDPEALVEHARAWIASRNWSGTPSAPALGGLCVLSTPSGLAIVDARALSERRVKVVTVEATPEYAKRYVEHVHNFGGPPYSRSTRKDYQ